MRLAKVLNGKVKTIIIADDLWPDHVNVTNTPCGIGWSDNGDGTFSDPYVPPSPASIVQINNIAFNGAGLDPDQPSNGRVDLISGMNVEITFNVLLPDNTKLTIPVKNRDTGQLKVIKAKVQSGSVAKTFKFNESGFYVIDSELVNSVGRDGVEFKLDPMLILVQDD